MFRHVLPDQCKNLLLLLVGLFLHCNEGAAQSHSFLRFSTGEGLAGDNIYDIRQDKDGFIWIATETGVSRFDGTSFKNYTVKDGLPGNDINWLFRDQQDRLWMSPFKKDICYYYRGRIHNKQNDPLIRRLVFSSEQKAMGEDADGNLLINMDRNILFIRKSGTCRTFSLPYIGPGFFKPVQLNGWIPITVVDTSLQKYQGFYLDKIVYEGVYRLGDHTQLAAPAAPPKRLVLFREGLPTETITGLNNMISVCPFTAPLILLNTASGCYMYDIRTKQMVDSLLTGVAVNISMVDRDSGIWVGTSGRGLFYFPHNGSVRIAQPDAQVYHFYARNDELWIGTNNWQFRKLDRSRQRLEREAIASEMDQRFLLPPEGTLIRYPEKSLFHFFTREGGVLKHIGGVKSVASAQDTLILACSGGEIYRSLLSSGKQLDSINIGERLTCALYREGTYYAGTLSGLYIYREDSMPGQAKRSPLVVKGAIHSIAYSYRNNLWWVTTSDDGVYCLKNDHVIRHFNEHNGLSSSICKCIFTDGTKAYVGTIDGLNVIDPEKGFTIDRYYTLDGLSSNNVNCIYAAGGRAWVGTSEGLSVIDLSKTLRKGFFKLCLTQIEVSGHELTTDTNRLLLAPRDHNIRFGYSGISFSSMGKIRYTYRLRGLSDVWQTTDQNYLQYPSLPSGHFIFELYATNRFNDQSNVVRFAFTIEKQWWKYGWVQLLSILLFIGLVCTALWLRIRNVQQRKQERIELRGKIVELEQLALRAQMNPHFIFNSLNSFYQYVIDKDLEGASKFIGDFSRLIRLLFETTALSELPLDKEIEFLSTYMALEQTKQNNAFSYNFVIQPDLLPEEILIPSFIIQPFIENSIRHGIQNRNDKEGQITVSFMAHDAYLVVRVDDTGVGRSYTDALKQRTMTIHNSKGIALTAERISLYNNAHGSDIRFEITDKYESGSPAGTLVTIYFPL